MGDSAPSINISADAIEYAEQKFLRLFGQDRESKELANWFKGLQQTALAQTSSVHCLGMRNPLPFDSIYQPNRILVIKAHSVAVQTPYAAIWLFHSRFFFKKCLQWQGNDAIFLSLLRFLIFGETECHSLRHILDNLRGSV